MKINELSIVFLILIAILLIPGGANAQRRTDRISDRMKTTETAILKLEREMMAAIRDKDAVALDRILADDFVYRSPAGPDIYKAAFIKNIVSLPVKITTVAGEDLKVNGFGEFAVLTGVQKATVLTEDGTEAVSANAFTDVFRLRKGRWQMVLAYGVELPAASK